MRFPAIPAAVAFALLATAPLALAQTASPPTGAAVSRQASLTATVESVDMVTREVVLRGENGRLVTIIAGPEVRNLAQVKAGDRVVIDYTEALAVEIARPGDTRPPVASGTVAGRAEPGQRPGAAAGQMVRVRVRIDAVDTDAWTVTFTDPHGVTHTVAVRDPGARDFVRTVRLGEQVDITYSEAFAIRVEPGAR